MLLSNAHAGFKTHYNHKLQTFKNIEGRDYMKNCPTIPINEETFDMSFW